ncbi:MAG TPA: hypothetical protein VFT64_00050 [Rickettsiales bacterium]|nr:hypothetical protein [Rickettsiales bacterium]
MLKLIAPFRVYFNLDSSRIATEPEQFTQFLKQVREEVQNPQGALKGRMHSALAVEINIPPEPQQDEIDARYTSLNTNGSLYLSQRIFTLRFKPSEAGDIEKIYNEALAHADEKTAPYSRNFIPDINAIRIDFYDNTIAILSLELVIDVAHMRKGEHIWDRLDKWTTVLVYHLFRGLYQSHIFPLLLGLSKFSAKHGGFIRDISQYTVFADLAHSATEPYRNLDTRFRLMWVNRTLFYTGQFSVNNWIKPLMENKATAVKIREAELYLHQGNNIAIMPAEMEQKHLDVLWDVMLSAQYYYAAMDVVNVNLVRYIGTTFNSKSSRFLNNIGGDMEDIINSITLLQMNYNDMVMDLQGASQELFQTLEKAWKFDKLVRNVERKMALCKANIAVLTQETGERSRLRTENILKGIAAVNLLFLIVALSAYAALLPEQKQHMLGRIPGLMDLGFIMSSNALAWLGIILIAVFAVMTHCRRNKKHEV